MEKILINENAPVFKCDHCKDCTKGECPAYNDPDIFYGLENLTYEDLFKFDMIKFNMSEEDLTDRIDGTETISLYEYGFILLNLILLFLMSPVLLFDS